MATIFISYSSKDRDKAAALAAAFEDFGHVVWWDNHLSGGENFRDKIDEHIAKANAVVVILTENSLQSRWVTAEALTALRRDVLVPVRYTRDVKPPVEYKHLHVELLSEWSGEPRAPQINKLVQMINRMKDAQDQRAVVDTLPFGLGQHVEKSNLFKAIFGSALPGGLRISRLVGGAVVGALAGSGALALLDLMTEDQGLQFAVVWFIVLMLALLISRVLDQLVLVGKDQSSDRFFDRTFVFALAVCCLLGAISSIGYTLLSIVLVPGPDLNLQNVVDTSVGLGAVYLICSYTIRVLITASVTLGRRI